MCMIDEELYGKGKVCAKTLAFYKQRGFAMKRAFPHYESTCAESPTPTKTNATNRNVGLFHITIPRVQKVPHPPLKTLQIVMWNSFSIEMNEIF